MDSTVSVPEDEAGAKTLLQSLFLEFVFILDPTCPLTYEICPPLLSEIAYKFDFFGKRACGCIDIFGLF